MLQMIQQSRYLWILKIVEILWGLLVSSALLLLLELLVAAHGDANYAPEDASRQGAMVGEMGHS